MAADPRAQIFSADGAALVLDSNPCPARWAEPVHTPGRDIAVHGSVPNRWRLMAHWAFCGSAQVPKAVPLLPVFLPHTRRDERPCVGAWRREARRHDLLHEDAGIEVADRSAVGKEIAGHLCPHTRHRRRYWVHGREPADAHSVRDLFAENPISAEAEDEGHTDWAIGATCAAETSNSEYLSKLFNSLAARLRLLELINYQIAFVFVFLN